MKPEEQAIIDAVSVKLLGEIFVGARVRFKDGLYIVTQKGAVQISDFGRRREQLWIIEPTTGHPGRRYACSEEELLVRLV